MNKINLSILACSLIVVSQKTMARGAVTTIEAQPIATAINSHRIIDYAPFITHGAFCDKCGATIAAAKGNDTLLREYASYGWVEDVKRLLQENANPDAKNAEGKSFRDLLSTYSNEVQQAFKNFEAEQVAQRAKVATTSSTDR